MPGMRERGWGRIANTAPMHGLAGLSKGVALDTAAQHITVNCICPAGPTRRSSRRRSMRAPRNSAATPQLASATCCARSSRTSRCCRPSASAPWRSSCAARWPRASPAWHCRSTAEGKRSEHQPRRRTARHTTVACGLPWPVVPASSASIVRRWCLPGDAGRDAPRFRQQRTPRRAIGLLRQPVSADLLQQAASCSDRPHRCHPMATTGAAA